MSTETSRPTVFISYSWKPTLNREKVIQLAERLSLDSIHVIIDVWDLKEGQDKNLFMEQMVNSPDVKRVLLICNKDYVEKANKRTGGVGIESMIVSTEIYNQAEQTKFIPIIFEYDENNNPYVPTFVNSRIFIDLSNDEVFEDNYEQLMRNLYDKPASKRPPYGTPPPYILNDQAIFLPTAHKVTTIKKSLIEEKKNTILLIQDYYDCFLKALDGFKIEENKLTSPDFDEVVLKGIYDITVLRDDFMNFIETYISYSVEIDVEKLHEFFERLLGYLFNLDGIGSNDQTVGYIKNDHFRFFITELFLHFSSLMIEKGRFKELAYVLHNPFIVNIERHNETNEYSFAHLRNYVITLNKYRNNRLQLHRISITADTIKEKATKLIKFPQLQEVDVLFYYISLFLERNDYSRVWFPETSCYRFYNLPLMNKAVSLKFFDKIKAIFNVSSKEELITKVNEIETRNGDYIARHEYTIPYIQRGLNLDKLCSIR